MNVFYNSEVQTCIALLTKAKTQDHAEFAWHSMQSEHPSLAGMISLESYKRSAIPSLIKKYIKPPHDYLVPYFESENIFFLDDDILEKMYEKNEIRFPIDYSLTLDTNIVSYINKLIRGEPLGNIQSKVIPFIDELLHDDLNFDVNFYMIENVKNLINIINKDHKSKLIFWKSLNKKFRENLVSSKIFISIDCKEYKKTCNPKPTITHTQAVRFAVNFAYDFYASKEGKHMILKYALLQRVMLLQIIGITRIQLSSKRSAKNKMMEYLEYVHNVIGTYFDRESIIAHKYFLNRNSVAIFKDIQKGMPSTRILKKLDNIAWDMIAPRIMENFILSMDDSERGRYFVPMFVSFDKNLRELLSLFPVKGAIYNKKDGVLIPIPKINSMEYFESHGFKEEMERFHAPKIKHERISRPKPSQFDIHKLITTEYRELRKVICKKEQRT